MPWGTRLHSQTSYSCLVSISSASINTLSVSLDLLKEPGCLPGTGKRSAANSESGFQHNSQTKHSHFCCGQTSGALLAALPMPQALHLSVQCGHQPQTAECSCLRTHFGSWVISWMIIFSSKDTPDQCNHGLMRRHAKRTLARCAAALATYFISGHILKIK